MSKDANLRLAEVTACIPTLVADRSRREQIIGLLHAYVAGLSGTERTALDKLLSFGGWHPFSTAADKLLRNQRRALLLAKRRIGPVSAAEKTQVEGLALPALTAAFAPLFAGVQTAPRPLEATLGPAFIAYASGAERNLASQGADEMRALLRRCLQRLSAVRSDAAAKRGFVEWFGAYSEPKLAAVLGRFNAMASAPKRLKLHYRGNGLPADATEALFAGDPPVRIISSTDAGYYSADARRDADPLYIHLFIGSTYFNARVGQTAQRGVRASRAGILIHELSHAVCRTNDEPSARGPGGRMYGAAACAAEAAAGNAAVLTNADTYRMYADFGL